MFNLGNAKRNVLGEKINNNYDFFYSKDKYDINSKCDSHAAIARNVKEKSVVLDVGCASGNIGKILKDFKSATIDGIEYNEEALEIARKKNCYCNLYSFSITDKESKAYNAFFKNKKKYDHIIFGDVLEHLDRPYDVLVQFSKLLKKDGSIIISLPNIAYIDTIIELIKGNFNYNYSGILDTTHLRFFTEGSFADMIENIGNTSNVFFDVKRVDSIKVIPDYIKDWESEIDKLFGKEKIDEYFVLQNIFVLTLSQEKKKTSKKHFNNNSKDIITNYVNMKNDFDRITKELDEIKNTCNNLTNERDCLQVELNNILSSKRWKLINKMMKLIGK